MTFYQLLSYNDVLLRTENGSRYLLLGNGFSIAYDEIFSFKNLFDYAVDKNLISVNSPLYNMFFYDFKTYDFEKVIKKLEESIIVYFRYHNYPYYYNNLHMDIYNLKRILIDVLSELHPENATILDEFNYSHAKSFIKEYKSIFTLNYDLLLNWISLDLEYAKSESNSFNKLKVDDGFRRPNGNLTFIENNSEQTIYYLHGALHIFDEDIYINKITSKNGDKSLIQQIKENISFSKYPLFVSEGTWQNKLSKIKKNIYLNHCFNSLKKLGFYNNNDSLVIFGTLLKSNDNHIIEAIRQNNIKNIYIGLSSENKMYTDCSHIIRELEETKNIYFYDYNTVHIWKSNFNNSKNHR